MLGEAAERRHTEHGRLLDRPGHRLRALPRTPRPEPPHPVDEGGDTRARGEHLAGRQLRQQVERPTSGLRRPAALDVTRQGVDRLAAVVAGADQPHQPRAVQPGRRECGPPAARAAGGPQVEGIRREPGRVEVVGVTDREQACCRGYFDVQRGRALVDVEQLGRRPEVPHPEPAGAERARRVGAPVLEQQLDMADDVEGSTRGGPVDEALVAAGRRELRHPVHLVPRGAAASEADRHLARHQHVLAVAGDHEPARQQLVHRRPRLRPADRVVGGLDRARGGVAFETVEDRARLVVDLGRPARPRRRAPRGGGRSRRCRCAGHRRPRARGRGPARTHGRGRSSRAAAPRPGRVR